MLRAASLAALLVCLGGASPSAVGQQGAVNFTALPEIAPDACRSVFQNTVIPVLNSRTLGLTITYPTSGPAKLRFQVVVTQQATQTLFDQWDKAVRELRKHCGCPPDTWLPRDRTANAVKDAIDNFLNDGNGIEHRPTQPGNRFGLLLRSRPERTDNSCPELPPPVSTNPAEVAGQALVQGGVSATTANLLPPADVGSNRGAPATAATGTSPARDTLDRLEEQIERSQMEIFDRMVQFEKMVTEKIDEWSREVSVGDVQRKTGAVQILGEGWVHLLIGATLGAVVMGTFAFFSLWARGRFDSQPEAIGRLADDFRSAIVRQDMTLRELNVTSARHRELLERLVEQASQCASSQPGSAGLGYVLPSPRHTTPNLPERPSRAAGVLVPAPPAPATVVNEAAILHHYNELVAGCGRDSDEEAFIEAYAARWAVAEQGNRLRLVDDAPPRGSAAFLVVVARRSHVLIYPAVSFRQTWAAVAGTPAADTVFGGVFVPLHGSGRYRVASAALGQAEGRFVRIDKSGTVEI